MKSYKKGLVFLVAKTLKYIKGNTKRYESNLLYILGMYDVFKVHKL